MFTKGKLRAWSHFGRGWAVQVICEDDKDALSGRDFEEAEANAQELVRRWNSHDKLIALIWKLHPKHQHDHDYFHDDCTLCGMEKLRCEKLEAAIASARS